MRGSLDGHPCCSTHYIAFHKTIKTDLLHYSLFLLKSRTLRVLNDVDIIDLVLSE